MAGLFSQIRDKLIGPKYEDLDGKEGGSSLGYSQDLSELMGKEVLSKKFIDAHKRTTLDFKRPFASHLLNAQYRDIFYTKLRRLLTITTHYHNYIQTTTIQIFQHIFTFTQI